VITSFRLTTTVRQAVPWRELCALVSFSRMPTLERRHAVTDVRASSSLVRASCTRLRYTREGKLNPLVFEVRSTAARADEHTEVENFPASRWDRRAGADECACASRPERFGAELVTMMPGSRPQGTRRS